MLPSARSKMSNPIVGVPAFENALQDHHLDRLPFPDAGAGH